MGNVLHTVFIIPIPSPTRQYYLPWVLSGKSSGLEKVRPRQMLRGVYHSSMPR